MFPSLLQQRKEITCENGAGRVICMLPRDAILNRIRWPVWKAAVQKQNSPAGPRRAFLGGVCSLAGKAAGMCWRQLLCPRASCQEARAAPAALTQVQRLGGASARGCDGPRRSGCCWIKGYSENQQPLPLTSIFHTLLSRLATSPFPPRFPSFTHQFIPKTHFRVLSPGLLAVGHRIGQTR